LDPVDAKHVDFRKLRFAARSFFRPVLVYLTPWLTTPVGKTDMKAALSSLGGAAFVFAACF
jgi:hypothetical protein